MFPNFPVISFSDNGWIVLLIVIWEFVWKGFGLWYAARNNQRNWFIAMLIINTVGILPIIYLKFFQKKQ
ncbi:MAG: DUF5652 family protein [Candidatus Daviesbacteria bacterium]